MSVSAATETGSALRGTARRSRQPVDGPHAHRSGEAACLGHNTTRRVARGSWADALALLILALWAWRLIVIQRSHLTFVGTDQIIDYFPAAQKLLDGHGLRSFRPKDPVGPGYPLMLAAATTLTGGHMFRAGKAIGVVASTAFLFFAYLLLRRVFGPNPAVAALAFTAGVNTLVFVACTNGTDLPFAALAMISLWTAARRDKPSYTDATIAGLFAGLATVVRLPGLLLAVFACIRFLMLPRTVCSASTRIALIGTHLLAFSLATSPWFLASYVLQHGQVHFRGTIGLDPSVLSASGSLLQAIFAALRHEPWAFIVRCIAKLVGGLPKVIRGLHAFPYPFENTWIMAGWSWILVAMGALLVMLRSNRLRTWLMLWSGLWMTSLVPIHYEARYYTLLIPVFAATAVWPFTGGVLPDVGFTFSEGIAVIPHRGWAASGILGRRVPTTEVGDSKSISLSVLIVTLISVVGTNSALKAVETSFRWHHEHRAGFHHELARFIREAEGTGDHRPVGVRAFSQARYWVPWEAGILAATLPREDYESILPQLSYVLYDQIEDEDVLYEWWDDPDIAALRDPAGAPGNLEAVYFKPDPFRAVLYRVLEDAKSAQIVSVSATSHSSENPAELAVDGNAATWWLSAGYPSAESDEAITLDLDRPTVINRIWLLPPPTGHSLPVRCSVEGSLNGEHWDTLIDEGELIDTVRQNPSILTFQEHKARYVRLGMTQLRQSQETGAHQAGLAEVKVGWGLERPTELPVFTLEPDGIFFDALHDDVVARVANQSKVAGRARVAFYQGWLSGDAEHIETVDSSLVALGELASARLSASHLQTFGVGSCRPIHAKIVSPLHTTLSLNTYGVGTPSRSEAEDVICSPFDVEVDGFEYPDSPLAHGWEVSAESSPRDSVMTKYDSRLQRRVMVIQTDDGSQLVVRRSMRVHDRPRLGLTVKATEGFYVYVAVRDVSGESVQLHYTPYSCPELSGLSVRGGSVCHTVGTAYLDGRWHVLERDLQADLLSGTGRDLHYVEAVGIRAYGRLDVAEVHIEASE